MKKFILIVTILFSFSCKSGSQGISKERINKIKSATVKVCLSDGSSGSGFFLTPDGRILTCWHVIAPSIHVDSLTKTISYDPIYIRTQNNDSISVGIAAICVNAGFMSCIENDYCLLVVEGNPLKTFPFLKTGNFDSVDEGAEIISCGYPLGMNQQFISKGIISTKYIDSSRTLHTLNGPVILRKPVALIDATLNKGNSGGPIMSLASNEKDDIVIGYADFVINPFGNAAAQIRKLSTNSQIGINMGGVDMLPTINLLATATEYASNGISGFVSINPFLRDIHIEKR